VNRYGVLARVLAGGISLSTFAAVGARAADLAAGKAKAATCVACHGAQFISEQPGTPSLAGQPDGFIQWQLVYFRAGTRKSDVMTPIAESLKDPDIRDLGPFLAAQSPPNPANAPDRAPELSASGAKLTRDSRCANCHGEHFFGQQAVARLAGQREDYLLKALRDFKAGRRTGGGGAMLDAVYPLAESDLPAVAHYLSRLPGSLP
jgi:cytochrome c553